jgi:hypothetical protein
MECADRETVASCEFVPQRPWRDRSPDVRLEGFSQDDAHVLVKSSSSAEATLIHLWWVPIRNDADEAPIQINRGNFATTWSPWQPTP